jgi:dolichol-phosphate mannosyltransferase
MDQRLSRFSTDGQLTTGPVESTETDQPQAAAGWQAPEISVVVPTLDERDNIVSLVENIDRALEGISHEIIFVDDDSADGTAEVAKKLAASRPDIRCIRRIGRRGLASACVEGMSASAAPFVAIIDADHQHDETILPKMLERARAGAELVVATRYSGTGGVGSGFSSWRHKASVLATSLSSAISGTNLSDPMSGFFLLRRELFDEVADRLSPDGFKVLLDLVVTVRQSPKRRNRPLKVAEVPYTFRARNAGTSKMSMVVAMQFLGLVVSKLTGGLLPASFLLFAAVGASGLVVHMATLAIVTGWGGLNFTLGQLLATIVAMTTNYILNNRLTYASQRLTGKAFWVGLLTFYGVCSFGTIANISVASLVYEFQPAIYVAGFAGALMSVVFNYSVTRVFTWRKH